MGRVVLVVAVICSALVIGLLVFLTSPSTRVEPTGATPRPDDAVSAPATRGNASASEAAASRGRRRAAAPESPPPEPEVEDLSELGTLRIETDVPGAQVFIDRQFIGTAPLTAKDITPGTHQLNVTAEGFDGIRQTIDVEPGPRDLSFRFREVRLDAVLAVVHKHRIGSCEGRLVATPDAIRYETTDTDDGFRAALSDLETFQVDYEAKNLRIRLRKGRQFNFTDPDENADRLFVFHRDVDKVRQQTAAR